MYFHVYTYTLPDTTRNPKPLSKTPQKEAATEKTQAFQIEQDRKRQGHTRSFQPKLGRAPCHGKSLSGINFTCRSLQRNVGYDRGLNNQNRAPLSDPFTVVLQGFRVHGPSKSEHESGVHCYLQYYIYICIHIHIKTNTGRVLLYVYTRIQLSVEAWGLKFHAAETLKI